MRGQHVLVPYEMPEVGGGLFENVNGIVGFSLYIRPSYVNTGL